MWKRDQAVTPAPPGDPRERPVTNVAPAAAAVGKPADNLVDLGKFVTIKGELSAAEDLTLYGQMEGSIRLPEHTLTVGPGADIKAEVVAKAVVIMGAVIGNVTAAEKIDIRATGSLVGDLASPRLAIAEGGSIRGRVEMPVTAWKKS